MAKVTWKHPAPRANPFEALVGDHRKYAVHLCVVESFEGEEIEILMNVVLPALESAKQIFGNAARCILFDFDSVYSVLTIVATDRSRSHDQSEVYKLQLTDWDHPMQSKTMTDDEIESFCSRNCSTMHGLVERVLREAKCRNIISELSAQGFEFWWGEADSEKGWQHIPV